MQGEVVHYDQFAIDPSHIPVDDEAAKHVYTLDQEGNLL